MQSYFLQNKWAENNQTHRCWSSVKSTFPELWFVAHRWSGHRRRPESRQPWWWSLRRGKQSTKVGSIHGNLPSNRQWWAPFLLVRARFYLLQKQHLIIVSGCYCTLVTGTSKTSWELTTVMMVSTAWKAYYTVMRYDGGDCAWNCQFESLVHPRWIRKTVGSDTRVYEICKRC